MTTTAGIAVLELEWWQRAGAKLRTWLSGHPKVVRGMRVVLVVVQAVAIILAIPTFILVPGGVQAVGWLVAMLVPVAVLFWLSRTKTIGWRMMSGLFTASMLTAPLIGWASVAAATLWGGTASSDGAASAIASHFEEVGKLLPLAVLVVLAPGRVRRFALVDWILVGYVLGAGFTAVEEAVRAINFTRPQTGLGFTVDADGHAPPLFLNPFAVSDLPSDHGASAGHPVWSALIAGGIGLGLYLWRRYRRSSLRWLGWVIGLTAVHWAVSDHMLFNTANHEGPWAVFGYEGVPIGSTAFWLFTGMGFLTPFVLFVLFVAALAIDVANRRVAAQQVPGRVYSVRVAERTERMFAWASEPTGRFARLARRGLALCAAAWFQWSADSGSALNGYRRRKGENRRSAVLRGRVAISTAQSARRFAMQLIQPGGRNGAVRWVTVVVTLVAVAWAVVVGTWLAGVIGLSVHVDGEYDSFLPGDFLAGLLERLQDWWNDLSPGQQLLITAVVVGVTVGIGAPLGASLLWAGIGSYGLSHASDLHDLATDPRESIRHYLLNRSPGDMLADAVELGLTVIPIRIGGKDAAWEIANYLGGEAVMMYTDEVRGAGQSYRDAHPSVREQIAMNDATPGMAPSNAPPAGPIDPPWHNATKDLSVGTDELVVGRGGLDPSTAYEVAGRGTYYTDASGEVTFVVESRNGSIDADLNDAASGVVYVGNEGVAFVTRADGGLWAVRVRVR